MSTLLKKQQPVNNNKIIHSDVITNFLRDNKLIIITNTPKPPNVLSHVITFVIIIFSQLRKVSSLERIVTSEVKLKGVTVTRPTDPNKYKILRTTHIVFRLITICFFYFLFLWLSPSCEVPQRKRSSELQITNFLNTIYNMRLIH